MQIMVWIGLYSSGLHGCLAWQQEWERLRTIWASLSSDICHLIFHLVPLRFTFCFAFFFLFLVWCHIQLVHLGDTLWTRADKQVVLPGKKMFHQSYCCTSKKSWINHQRFIFCCFSGNMVAFKLTRGGECLILQLILSTSVMSGAEGEVYTYNLECNCTFSKAVKYHRTQSKCTAEHC